ncbi:hypothetical protein AKJ57_04050 [candidate division MSBL1 archaeon SCGC-AAA259A05]|uniref:Uncharacterized protein n=1 Tax=candidate division MSBL1 archaeon SCGC-AAA259A05 TaxID=1698259 RepID=A0A133U8Q4_9EURY|nr:hypothetical protein AKJ57_04050 [candidate division MSBL1 archaeon SCGC-AAA259A05]
MVSVSEYRKYREISRGLNSKIMDLYIDEYRLEKAIDFLGIEKEEDHAIFESEWELHILMDFAIHEIRKEGKTAVEVYQEEVNPDSEAEKRALRAYLSSYTSLFKVKSIKRDESSLMLKDLLEGEENSELVDYSLSRSALPGHLLFTRLCPISSFNITSGVEFVFPPKIENSLISDFKELREGIDSEYSSVKQFASFFKLYRERGIEVQYDDLEL